MFRYQDDCIVIDDDGLFAQHYEKMYPKEMVLNCTNLSPNKSNFLDLTISIYRQKFMYYSWDKRREFKFQVINYPNLSGNIPSNQSYGTYTSQLIRFCDINMPYKYFVQDIQKLTEKFSEQGFLLKTLKDKMVQFRKKYFFKWAKFNKDISESFTKIFRSCLI